LGAIIRCALRLGRRASLSRLRVCCAAAKCIVHVRCALSLCAMSGNKGRATPSLSRGGSDGPELVGCVSCASCAVVKLRVTSYRSSCCCCAHPRNRSVTPSACHQRARQASSVHAKLHLDRGVRFRKNIRPGRHSFPATEPGSTARSRARRGGAGTGRDGVERRTISALEGRAGPARGREGR
jgi:hypothetical protein